MPMPSRIAYPLAATALAFGLSACGDDITEINANVGAIKSTPPKNPNK